MSSELKVVALAGGVGGAKLATGLQAILPAGTLTVIVNTADDFEHWGLTICPDLDTVLYNLADLHNLENGWGRRNDTFVTLDMVGQLGGEDWFRVGDRDLALHLRRSEWLRQGHSLNTVTDRLRLSLGIRSIVLPMCNEPVRTLVHTDEGDLPFQHYFVRRRCEPIVMDLSFVGVEQARLSPEVRTAIKEAELIIFCPSNPYVSLDPILSVPGLRTLIRNSSAPKIAVSPIVGGQALKGPAAKMMVEMGKAVNPHTVAEHYKGLLSGFVLDRQDVDVKPQIRVTTRMTDTLMTDTASRIRVAEEVVAFGKELLQRKKAIVSVHASSLMAANA